MIDGPADTLVDHAVNYLADNSIDVATIGSAISDETSFPRDRFPVLDTVVDAYTEAGRPVERIDVIATLSLIVGWASAESRWIRASGMTANEARAAIISQATLPTPAAFSGRVGVAHARHSPTVACAMSQRMHAISTGQYTNPSRTSRAGSSCG
jgi:hypothetical protein